MIIYNLLFYLFSFFMILAACGVIFSRNQVHSVLFLIFTFFNAAALFVMLGAEFLAATIIIVYVGAIAVLFLFVIMMLNLKENKLKFVLTKNFKVILIFGIILLFELIFIIYISNAVNPRIINSPISVPSPNLTNTERLGILLFTEYYLMFEIAGLILFVAMISAIVLTLRKSKLIKKQDITSQLARNKENSVKIIKSIKIGHGVDPIRK